MALTLTLAFSLPFFFFLFGARRGVEGDWKSCRPILSTSHVPVFALFTLYLQPSLSKKKITRLPVSASAVVRRFVTLPCSESGGGDQKAGRWTRRSGQRGMLSNRFQELQEEENLVERIQWRAGEKEGKFVASWTLPQTAARPSLFARDRIFQGGSLEPDEELPERQRRANGAQR